MKKKILLFTVFALILILVPARDEDVWNANFKKISEVVSIVEDNYYREIDYDKLAHSSIKGLLLTLDPHSFFLDKNNLSRMREEYKGKFYGLGIQIQKQEDRLVVISPIEGTPAYKLGIQAGDIISHINGESTKPISSLEAVEKLRGPKGTKVSITIVREGLDKSLELTVIRDEVPLHSVPYAFILKEDIGYIFIRNFAETTNDEFRKKMKILSRQGMKRLILDLRYNSGGPLFQAIEISDQFLPKGTLIVSIKGRKKDYNKEFMAIRDNQNENIPLVILINAGSASASEIVAGAVKDNDRGLIVGETSWGKGLVQTVFNLDSTTALALTTGKYLTPSGRSIQRDYSRFEDYYIVRREAPEEEREVRYTSGGRKVLGQGGISPDFKVKVFLSRLTVELRFKGAFFAYAKQFANHKTPLSKKFVFIKKDENLTKIPDGKKAFGEDFVVDEAVIEDFKNYLKRNKITFEPVTFEKFIDEIQAELKREIFSFLWGIEAGRKVFAEVDPVVSKAIEVFPQAEKLVK
ncbi:MAG: S41 family peptidase [Candidatus Aminicenantaceae bacterium]